MEMKSFVNISTTKETEKLNNSTAASQLMIKSQLFDKAKELIKKESRMELTLFSKVFITISKIFYILFTFCY